jgi:hypothetical protein
MTEMSAVTPIAMSVQTKKKPPLEFAMPTACSEVTAAFNPDQVHACQM